MSVVTVTPMVTRREPKRDRAAYMRAYRCSRLVTPAEVVTPEVVTPMLLEWTNPVVKELFGIEAIVRRAAAGLQTAPDAACLRGPAE
jgi:hypothetical protein